MWSVTVEDVAGCDNTGGTQLVYTNLGMGTQLDIITSSMTPDDGSNSGAIDITPVGGGAACMPYSYEWYYQDGSFVGNSEDISGLEAGWYTVLVTCADDSDETIGWFYVEPERRGRGKSIENAQFIKAYPNPFSTETTVEFSSSVTEKVNIEVYSLDGKLITELYNGLMEADQMHQVQFSAKDKPAGVYIVQFSTESGNVKREKLIVVK